LITSDNEQLSKIETVMLQLDASQEGQDFSNRRHAKRVNARMPMKVTLLAGMNRTQVDIFSRNISSGGIGFISRRHFKADERIAIHLIVKGQPNRLILARVTFGRYVASGLFEMGAEFLECLKDNQARIIPRHWLLTHAPAKPAREEKAARPENSEK
jgi:hypothetical protein